MDKDYDNYVSAMDSKIDRLERLCAYLEQQLSSMRSLSVAAIDYATYREEALSSQQALTTIVTELDDVTHTAIGELKIETSSLMSRLQDTMRAQVKAIDAMLPKQTQRLTDASNRFADVVEQLASLQNLGKEIASFSEAVVVMCEQQNQTVVDSNDNILQSSTEAIESNLQLSKSLKQNGDAVNDILVDLKETRKSRTSVWQVILTVLLLCSSGLGLINTTLLFNETEFELNDRINNLEMEAQHAHSLADSIEHNTESHMADMQNSINELTSTLSAIGDKMPFIITGVRMYNQGESIGATIYSRNTTYIFAVISYYGIKDGANKQLAVKFITPTGLSTGDGSSDGYSFFGNLEVSEGENTYDLTGWGSPTPGHWQAGSYRYEIYDRSTGQCLYVKKFTIL